MTSTFAVHASGTAQTRQTSSRHRDRATWFGPVLKSQVPCLETDHFSWSHCIHSPPGSSCDDCSDHQKAVTCQLPVNPSQRAALQGGSPPLCKAPSRQDRGRQARHRDGYIQVDLLHTGMKVSMKKKISFWNINADFTGSASW